jgi:hypothetical protein
MREPTNYVTMLLEPILILQFKEDTIREPEVSRFTVSGMEIMHVSTKTRPHNQLLIRP